MKSWQSAQKYCQNLGGDLPVVKYWEDLQRINSIAKPWPVYMGLREVVTGNTEVHELVDVTTFASIL